jgi:ATP-dependent Clp protease ATP-binding subunit ClpB
VDFKNTIVIMTSNVGSQVLHEQGLSDETIRERVMAALRGQFRPEFLNRVDEIVVFHSLTRQHLEKIVEIQLRRLRGLLAERKLTLELTEKARRFLADAGYDPVYGARPLKRAIQRHLQDPLALALVQGDFKEGDAIVADVAGDALVFHKRVEAEVV